MKLWNLLTRCRMRSTVTNSPRSRSRTRLALSTLESRDNPSGSVTTLFNSLTKTLSISAMNGTANWDITVQNNGSAGSIKLLANDGETFSGNVTTFSNVRNIDIILNGGTDHVTVDSIQITGNLTVEGYGNDQLDVIGTNQFYNVKVSEADGDVTTNFSGTTTVGSLLEIHSTTGATSTQLGSGPGDSLTARSISIHAGDRGDFFRTYGIVNANFVSIDLGTGGSDAAWNADSTIVGNFSFAAGAGFDDFGVNSPSAFIVNGAVTVNTGNGGGNVVFAPVTTLTLGPTSITGGSGNDSVQFNAPTTTLNGPLLVSTLGGSDTLAFNGAASTVNGPLTYTSTAGFDTFDLNGDTFQGKGPVTMNLGAGGSEVYFAANNSATVTGAFNFTGGSGDDSLLNDNPGSSLTTGAMTLNFGTGSDTALFSTDTTINGDATFNKDVGQLTVNAIGSDLFKVEGNLSIAAKKADLEVSLVATLNDILKATTIACINTVNNHIRFGNGLPVSNVLLGSLKVDTTGHLGLYFNAKAVVIDTTVKVTTSASAQDSEIDTNQIGNTNTFEVKGATKLLFKKAAPSVLELNANTSVKLAVVNILGGNGGHPTGFGNAGGAVTTRAITIKNGAGNNDVNFGVGGVIITGNLSVKNISGNDTLTASGKFTATGNVKLDFGSGDSNTSFNDNTLIQGTLTLNALDGYDQLQFTAGTLEIVGAATLTIGDGGSFIYLASTTTNLKGAFAMNALDGNDSFLAQAGTYDTKSLLLNLGDGDNQAHFDGSAGVTIDGALTVNTLDGSDVIAGDQMTVTGIVNFNTGAGKDVVGFGNASRLVNFSALNVNSGLGDDIVGLLAVVVDGGTGISTGDGADTVLINGTTFNSAVIVDAGAGADSVTISNSTGDGVDTVFKALATIALGNGDDHLYLSAASDDIVAFQGPVIVIAGTGADGLTILGAEAGSKVTGVPASIKTQFEFVS